MRYFGKPKAEVSRAQRRCHLAILIAATGVTLSTHAMADDELAPVAGVTANPFCDRAVAVDQPIQLASDGSVRLVPIGRAIGLQPITQATEQIDAKGAENAALNHSKPQTPALTFDAVQPPVVRSNPLANAKAVATPVKPLDNIKSSRLNFVPPASPGTLGAILQTVAGDKEESGNPKNDQSRVVRTAQTPNFNAQPSLPQGRATSQRTPKFQQEIETEEIETEEIPVTIATVPAEGFGPAASGDAVAHDQASPVVEQDDPIMFSLSDDEEAVSANLLEALTENEPDEVTIAEVPLDDNSVEWSLSDADEPVSESMIDVDLEMIDIAPPVDLQYSESSAPEYANESLVEDPANEMLRRDRYRPPVEVQSVPVTIERLADNEEDMTAVSPVEDVIADILRSIDLSKENELAGEDSQFASHLDSSNGGQLSARATGSEPELAPLPAAAKLELPEGMKAIPLRLNFAQVRSLTVGGSLKDIRIMDQSICQAVATSNNQIKLIGTGNGVTQLVVWAEVEDETKPTRVQAFDIIVDSHEKSAAADDSMSMLDQSIKQTFPNSEVTLDSLGDRVRVSGHCSDDATAKKILRMVRRTCSIPVEDHLEVRHR
jgi:Pilus formation protein N terminal region